MQNTAMDSAAATRVVTVRYFASVREAVGTGAEELAMPDDLATVADFIAWLRGRDASYRAALADALRIRVAVDRVHATPDTPIQAASEIALFPMMTGG